MLLGRLYIGFNIKYWKDFGFHSTDIYSCGCKDFNILGLYFLWYDKLCMCNICYKHICLCDEWASEEE